GGVTTDDANIAERVRSLRHHGWSPSNAYDDMPAAAFNYRLSDVLAALGIPQLRRLDELLAKREAIAAGYAERLAHLDVVLPVADAGDRHGLQAYRAQVERRDDVMAAPRAERTGRPTGTYSRHP